MVGALVTYSLFMWDSFQPEASEHMDDYVFYIKVLYFLVFYLLMAVNGGKFSAYYSHKHFK